MGLAATWTSRSNARSGAIGEMPPRASVSRRSGPRHCGGLSSPASQPTASDFMGSTGIETCSARPQVEHSNVRNSKPRSPEKCAAGPFGACTPDTLVGR